MDCNSKVSNFSQAAALKKVIEASLASQLPGPKDAPEEGQEDEEDDANVQREELKGVPRAS